MRHLRYKKNSFKDMDLWEIFQEDFENFTQEDFRLANIYNIEKF